MSARSNREKGNLGERQVKAALTALGFVVRDGAGSESGADLYIFHKNGQLECEAEVKKRATPPYDLPPKQKRAIARRAASCRALGWAYRLYYIEDSDPSQARVFTVGGLVNSPNRNGVSLQLYEAGLLSIPSMKGGAQGGGRDAPSPRAESRDGKMRTVAIGGAGESLAMGHTQTAARPAIEEGSP